MATLKFELRKKSIRLVFNYGKGNRLRYSTGLFIKNPKNWDTRKLRVKNVLAETDKDVINEKLDELQVVLNKKYTELSVNPEVVMDNELLKEIVDEVLNKKSKKAVTEKKELLPFFKWYLEYYATHPIPTTGKPLSKGTVKTYKNTYSKLKKFSSSEYKLRFNKITLGFYEDFVEWLYNKDYSTNYIGTIIKILKTIMNAAYEKGLHNNLDFQKRGFKKPTEEVDNVYLNLEELGKFQNADLSSINLLITKSGVRLDREKLERARDLFLISAYTGLRVGDFNRLTEQHFTIQDGVEYLSITTYKTGKKVTIPLHPVVKEILNKRDGLPPEKLPEQHINYALKKIAEKAGLTQEETKTVTRAGKKTTKTYKKYELVTNHTGRRSFCTNAYLSDMPTVDIMAISGHSSEKTFYGYIKADHLQKAKKISKYKFFQG